MEERARLEELVDKLLFWALEDERRDLVKHATDVFLKGSENGHDMQGFNDWFVHDYVNEEGQSLSDLYMKDHDVDEQDRKNLNIISNSVYSAFERLPIKDKMVVKDIFTKSDHTLQETFDIAGVVVGRIYKIDGKYYMADHKEFMPDDYKTLLVKGMLEKYNEYCSLFAPIQMDDFVKKHSLVLYRFLSIIDKTATEHALDEEDYLVHQSTYVVKSQDEAHKTLKVNEKFILSLDDKAGAVFKLVSGEHDNVIAEIVLADDRLEIECTTADALDYSKEITEQVLGENVAHLRDEVLNIDDLIG